MKTLLKSLFICTTILLVAACNEKKENKANKLEETAILEVPITENKRSKISHKTININGVDIFYREAGEQNKQTILLLHGFPSSSHMFRDVIELLSNDYHLIAPDYPGFGLSDTPSIEQYEYTFDNISATMDGFIDQLSLSSFYLLMQDYGGPVGFRIATKRPELIDGLIIQNANTYLEGLGEWSMKIGAYVESKDFKGLKNFREYLMSPEGIKEQYLSGASNLQKVDPISYLTDDAFMKRKGVPEVQAALFNNYGTNFPRYQEWQNYLKKEQPKTLIVWGENDKFFNKQGGDAYKKDNKNVSVYFFSGGHFILEEYSSEVADLIKRFINS